MDVFDRLLEELIHLSEDFVYGVGFCQIMKRKKCLLFKAYIPYSNTLSQIYCVSCPRNFFTSVLLDCTFSFAPSIRESRGGFGNNLIVLAIIWLANLASMKMRSYTRVAVLRRAIKKPSFTFSCDGFYFCANFACLSTWIAVCGGVLKGLIHWSEDFVYRVRFWMQNSTRVCRIQISPQL
jgi:hypothetical protein